MAWFWFSVIIILILTMLAFFWAVRVRRKRFEHKLRLEITNEGNVESHYQLQAEELSGQLQFQFSTGSMRLPEVIKMTSSPRQVSSPAQSPRPSSSGGGPTVVQKAQKGLNLTYLLAGLLTSLGTIIPGSLGTNLSQAGNRMYSGSAQASRVQQVSGQASSLAQTAKSSPSHVATDSPEPQPATEPVQGISWVETPPVQPGQMLAIDLLVRSAWVAKDVTCPFLVKSRSTEGGNAPVEVKDGQVEIQGGFWSHRVYPILLILGLAILALILAIWISRINGLPV